jgi:hypothetical protein
VFITSNNEKRLPDAFLRRSFHYIRFPDKETMEDRGVHFPALKVAAARGDGGVLRCAVRPEEEA